VLPERWRLTHVGCSEPAYNWIYLDGRRSRLTAYTGLHPDGDVSGGLLKDGGSATLDARSQPIMGYSLMAAPSRSTTYTGLYPGSDPSGGPSERWRLSHVGCSELAYNGIYADGRPSRSTVYTGLHPDGDLSGGLLKDGGSPTLDAQSQPIM